ncbi:MAG: DUF3450 domain-containing protein [Pseudomonadota bacterium]
MDLHVGSRMGAVWATKRYLLDQFTRASGCVPGASNLTRAEAKPLGEAMMKRVKLLGSAAALIAVLSAPAMAQFKPALNESERIAKDAKASQERIDQLDDQTARLLNDYRANLRQLEAANRYNASLSRNIDGQLRQIERLQADIDNIAGLQRAMQPLMEDMLDGLDQLIQADLPFNIAERQARVARLKSSMDNPSVTAAQRYRLIIEAYQIENEVGRTIGQSEGIIQVDGQEISGEFLRIGRVALMFKTADDSVLKIYDKTVGDWVDLNKSYLPDVKLGLRMAKEQTAPGLLAVPVKAPAQ